MGEGYWEDVRTCGVNENIVIGREKWRKDSWESSWPHLRWMNGAKDNEEDEKGL